MFSEFEDMRIIEKIKSLLNLPRPTKDLPRSVIAGKGEELARKLLKKKGYQILETGWRWHRNEVDIIARKDNLITFVEVKTRSNTQYGLPQEHVKYKQQQRLITSARAYISKHQLQDYLIRFDIVAILMPEDSETTIDHIENAFQPRKW